jgi:thiamine-phosphate pyrophosphorylase
LSHTPSASVDFQLYLITDRKLVAPRPLAEVCEAVLAALARSPERMGVALQLREKDLDGRALYELAVVLRAICTRHGARLLVNDRLDVALAADADGVHLSGGSFTVADARRLLGPSRLVGVSTHSAAEAAAAAAAGADFAVFGPVWQPLSKAAYGPARGGKELAAACRAAAGMPVFALGGVTAERVVELDAPVGVAVIGAILGADDPPAAARALAAALHAAGLAPR